MCSTDCFLGILAILFPPLPVWVKRGICSADSIINILLCMLGFIPGLLHAWYIIAKNPEPDFDYEALPQDYEGGRVRYIIIDRHNCPQDNKLRSSQRGASGNNNNGNTNNNVNYGTTSQGASQPQPQPQQQGVASNGEGSSNHQGVPPSYAEVVAGDNKVQTHD